MSKQMPFDIFVGRKLQKWQQRAEEHKLDFVDAVGVSPIEEMIYFWNGFKKMPKADLEVSLQKLRWSETSAQVPLKDDTVDERAIFALLKATVMRNLQQTEEAREILTKYIISQDRMELKGGVKDNWTSPVAHYEMGVTHWFDFLRNGERSSLDSSREWLDKAAAWESYDLDARYVEFTAIKTSKLIIYYRVGMRIKTGQLTVKREIEMA
jgi:uncharacterized protein DUF3808